MFNDYANHVPWSAYLEAFSEIKLPVVLPKAAFNLEAPRRHLADRRRANRPPCRGKGRIAQMRWGFPPARPKAPPVINFRSEGRRFERGRCLVPASWFMNSAATSAEGEVEVHQARRGLVLFRRIVAVGKRQWPGGIHALTTAPDPDIAPVHNGQMVCSSAGIA